MYQHLARVWFDEQTGIHCTQRNHIERTYLMPKCTSYTSMVYVDKKSMSNINYERKKFDTGNWLFFTWTSKKLTCKKLYWNWNAR